ncbi:uncharacterized protein [Ptychodera flava]|uniref:uncharacterized protein n=1 Tax=Ptychodera flava TaxID=63121 RepID=UPI003969EA49
MGCGASKSSAPIVATSPRPENTTITSGLDEIHNPENAHFYEEEEEEDFSNWEEKGLFDGWIRKLKETDNYVTFDAVKTAEDMAECLDPTSKQRTIKQAKYLVKIKYVEVFLKMFDYLKSFKLETSSHKFDSEKDMRAAYVYDCAKIVLWNGSDALPAMCREIGKAGIIKILFDQLKDPENSPSNLTGEEDYSFINPDRMVRSNMGILHNVIRNCLDNRVYFREANAVDLLSGYLNCKHATIQAISVLILAYVIKDEEVDKISTGDESVKFLLMILKSAIAAEDHMSPEYFFDVTEIVDGLIYLAANDGNKLKFVENGVLPLLVQLLQPECSTLEQRLAATAIWTLAFHNKNKDRIRNEKGCLDALKKLQNSDDKDLKKACSGALWELREEDQDELANTSLTRGLSQVKTGHVMISYQWDCQKLVIAIKDRLKAAGFNVWMDIEQMGGSTLEAMAGAVEKAEVVLICMSEKYKDSPSCRSEAEYTYKLHKPFIPLRVQRGYAPDGWLGILIGTKLYFDFSDLSNMEKMTKNLIKELGQRGRRQRTNVFVEEVQAENAVTTRAENPQVALGTSAQLQSNADVTQWLIKNNLGHMKGRFSGYTGEDLRGLKTILIKSPEFFYSSATTDKGLKNLLDLVKLERALEKLD